MNEKDRRLGMGRNITRRDFLQTTLLGTGSALLQAGGVSTPAHAQSPAESMDKTLTVDDSWYGYGGTGDYAPSHGNSPGVVNTAHAIREGLYNEPVDIIDTGETYDLVIVGAGMSGLGAAYEYNKSAAPGDRCLIIENHPIFGGESKRNEFEVDGHTLIGPQGANGFSVPTTPEARAEYADFADLRYMRELEIPTENFTYAEVNNKGPEIKLARDNYGFQYWQEDTTSVGYRGNFDSQYRWIKDPLATGYRDMPGTDKDRHDLSNWRSYNFKAPDRPNFEEWLDTMSYKEYVEDILGFSPAVTRHADPIMAGSVGLGCDAISAYAGRRIGLPVSAGLRGNSSVWTRHSFPGGNDGFSRHFLKKIMPHALAGTDSFADIMNGKVNFESLDEPEHPVRMRLNSTVVHIQHDGNAGSATHVSIIYASKGKTYRLKARKVVMATGGWVNKHIVKDLPQSYREAYNSFFHVPFLVANVAVKNWRFFEKLGIGACIWNDGSFGNVCNIRLPMTIGDYQPPVDPDQPTIITFYVSFYYPGLSASAQGIRGRAELFSTSYAEYERRIRLQMVELFGETGFDPVNDIAGIVLNRWGHAYVAPQPGFFFGTEGKEAPRETIRQPFGRIAFAHSELGGLQHWGPAADEGKRAVEQLSLLD